MSLFRGIWVDEGNDADYGKLSANAITQPGYAIRDPRVTGPYLNTVSQRGFQPFVYAVASWYPTLSAQAFATAVSQRLTTVLDGASPAVTALPVMLDIEAKGVDWELACLRQWRRHRRHRVTDLTIEGHKGGLYSPEQAAAVTALVRYVVPQCYDGNMSHVWDSLAMARDLTDAGFPLASVLPFLDAAHLGQWWQGFAFTQGRLP